MKAAILNQAGSPLEIKEVTSPTLHASSVRIRVFATHILPSTSQLVGGQFPFPLPTPYTPGLCAIGIVEEIADDVLGLKIGQKVFCSPLISSRNNTETPEHILKGWFGVTTNCEKLLDQWKNGTFAEQTVYPVECVTPLDLIDDYDDSKLACIYYLCIAYGAFLRGEFKLGQSVLINGATGNLGAASVLLALGMGASKIFAVGRNISVLHSLEELDPHRISIVSLPENIEDYGDTFSSQIGTEVDLMIDGLGAAAHPALIEAGISTLRQHGTAVFAGGIAKSIQISYLNTIVKELNIKGSFMYPSSAPADIIRMVHTGTLNLDAFHPKKHHLEQINEAIAEAAQSRGLEYFILQP